MTSRTFGCSTALLSLAIGVAVAGCAPSHTPPTTPATSTVTSEPTSPAGTAATPPAATAAPTAPSTPGPNVTPDGVVFNFKPERKGNIYLPANFNDWNPANDKYVLKDDDGDGMWSITVKLGPGSYQYKFVIEGQWIKDPHSPSDAPDGFGGRNGKFDVK